MSNDTSVTTPPPGSAPEATAAVLARRLAILDALTTALSEVVDLDTLLGRALDTVLDITGVDGGGIFLFDEHSPELRLTVHRGVGPRLVESFAVTPSARLHALASDPGAAVIVSDVTTLGSTRREMAAEGIKSYAGIPLHVRGHGLGALMAISHTHSDFNAADVELLVSIGKQIGLAIERARLYEREQRWARHLETINEVGRRLGAIRSERELLPQIVRHVRDRLGYEGANLLLLDEAGGDLILEAAAGLGNDALTGKRIPGDPRRSISGWVVAHNEPLLANDVSREPRYFPGGGSERAELAVPIATGAGAFGVLDVQSSRAGAFSEMDVSVLQILAGQIAVAIENTRLYEATERSLGRARAFQKVAAALTSSLDLRTTLEHTLEAAMGVFGADRAGLYLVNPDRRRMYCAASHNLSAGYLAAVQEYYDTHEWPVALDVERSIYVADAQEAPHLTPELTQAVRREGFRSMLYLPLPDGRNRVGTLVLYHNRVRRYSAEEIALARTFADQANVAIRHANLYEAERHARQQAAAILEATRTVTSSLHLDDVLKQAGACIAAALRQKVCAVWLLDEDGALFRPAFRVSSRHDPELDELFRTLPPLRIEDIPGMHEMLEQRRAYIIQRVDQLSPAQREIQRKMPFHMHVGIALAARDHLVGIATVPIGRPDHEVDPADVEVAVAIARSVALAVENARLYEQAARLAASEERNRLARELHDSVTHALFSMTLISQALPRIMERDRERARERMDRLTELGQGALAEMRALIFQLRPAALAEEGLAAALKKHTAAFESRESVTVELQLTGERRLPAPIEETVFRVTQEALNNVAKHARATRVSVRLTVADALVELTVTDNGRGFDPAAPPSDRRSLGMTSMRERAALHGGACSVISAPGQGATVHLQVPLHATLPA